MLFEPHARGCGVGVLADVRQRFLHDAEDRCFHIGRQSRGRQVVGEFDPCNFGSGIGHQRFDGVDDPQLVEGRRPEAADQPPRLVGRRPQKTQTFAKFAVFGRATQAMFAGLQLHHRPGEILGESVVNLIGDELPLAFLDLEQPPQQVSLVLQRLLRCLEREDIFAADENGRRAAIDEHRSQPQQEVVETAVGPSHGRLGGLLPACGKDVLDHSVQLLRRLRQGEVEHAAAHHLLRRPAVVHAVAETDRAGAVDDGDVVSRDAADRLPERGGVDPGHILGVDTLCRDQRRWLLDLAWLGVWHRMVPCNVSVSAAESAH